MKCPKNKQTVLTTLSFCGTHLDIDMKHTETQSNLLGSKLARVSSLLTLGLTILGPEMRVPKAWAATVTGVGSESAVAWSHSVDWATAGAEFSELAPEFSLNVTPGLSLTVSTPSGSMSRRDQDSGWMGCFAAGESLLWKHEDFDLITEPITVSFSSPVRGVGSAIQNDAYGNYVGWIEAFDAYGNLVGSYSSAGVACYCPDGSPSFVGVLADSAVISYVKFGVAETDSFAIGQLDLLFNPEDSQLGRPPTPALPEPTPVPEVGTVAAAGVFGLLIAGRVWRRKVA
jgi:hypothetical protein